MPSQAPQPATSPRRHRRLLIAACIALPALATVFAWAVSSQLGRAVLRTYVPWLSPGVETVADSVAPPLPQAPFDCEGTPLPWIEPGTIIDDRPPADWTHLVLKNDVRVTAGNLSPEASRWNAMAEMFALALLAHVQPREAGGDFYLARAAIGWCHPIAGHGRVISSRTHERLGANLDPLQAVSLSMRELDCEQHVRVVARSATTLFYDLERVLAFGDRHLTGILRHALLVHPRTGEFAAWLWMVPPAEIDPPPPGFLERLSPNLVTTFELQFLPQQDSLLSMPAPADYGVLAIPRGFQREPIAGSLAALAYAPEFEPTLAAQLELRLRQLQGWASPPATQPTPPPVQ